MPTKSTLPLHPHPTPQAPHPPSTTTTTPSQQTSTSSSPAAQSPLPPTARPRPQRQAATKARQRLVDAYALYPFEQEDADSDSEDTLPRPRAPRPTPVHSDDESSDSDVFVDDSEESECSRSGKGALGRKMKRKRRASSMIGVGEARRLKAVEMDDRVVKEEVEGFVVKSGNVMRDMLLGKASWSSWGSLSGPAEGLHGANLSREVRRAGLSDMGPAIGSNVLRWRDEVWTKGVEGSSFSSRKAGARGGPVDGDGYRASRFCEHF